MLDRSTCCGFGVHPTNFLVDGGCPLLRSHDKPNVRRVLPLGCFDGTLNGVCSHLAAPREDFVDYYNHSSLRYVKSIRHAAPLTRDSRRQNRRRSESRDQAKKQSMIASLVEAIMLQHLGDMSPWLDGRIPPNEVKRVALEAQIRRRLIKTHLPLDALVYF